MGKVYAVLANKGGVGKTSFITNTAAALSLKYPNKKTLIVDTDGQGNASLAFNINPDKLENTVYDCMVNELPAEKAIVPIRENLDILPANEDMNYFELDVLPDLRGRKPFDFLKKVIDQVKDQYDYIFIDSPPEMKMIAGNIMMVADEIYVPFKPEIFSVQGLIRVVKKINEFKETLNIHPKIGGIIGMMIRRTNLHSDMMLQADAYCKKNGIRLLNTRIPESIRYADATAKFGMPEVWADPNSPYAELYFELLEEVTNG